MGVVDDGRLLSNVVSSQIETHRLYGGVVPEIATRQHLAAIRPVTQAALMQSGLRASDIEGVAATRGPGLPPALMIGFRAAQGFAYALNLPFVGLHHHEAHLYSAWTEGDPPRAVFDSLQPAVSLIVSGGHTLLLRVDAPLRHEILGGTIDDAAGECFDKVAKMIGLPYPGGPEVDRLAGEGDPNAYRFPRPMLKERNDDFSFSGLKTAVRVFLQKNPEVLQSGKGVRDVCASIQAAIVDVLVTKTMRAVERLNRRVVTGAGGVICNRGLRAALELACSRQGIELRLASPKLCTDNAGMVGLLAAWHFRSGLGEPVKDEDIRPGWRLGT